MTERIGLLTSGGDAPGMNAAIRAIVRTATEHGIVVVGVRHGYEGLIQGDVEPLDNRAVGGIIERGGTILRSARSAAFLTEEGQAQALSTVADQRLDGLIVVGGNGSLAGARWLDDHGVPTVGIPASIDNDVPETAMAIGVDTALNTVVECLNRIRDTAVAHERAFVVEVMGRKSGFIALTGGLAGGAEIVLLPEFPVALSDIAERVLAGVKLGKKHSIIVVAEGFVPTDEALDGRSPGRAITSYLEGCGTLETRLTILGHLLRGGSPSAFDRVLANRLAEAAVDWLSEGTHGRMAAWVGGSVVPVPFDRLDAPCHNVDPKLLRLVDIVAH